MESDKNSAADQTVYSDRLPLEMQTNPGCGMHQTGHWQMWMQKGNYLYRHSARENYKRSPAVAKQGIAESPLEFFTCPWII